MRLPLLFLGLCLCASLLGGCPAAGDGTPTIDPEASKILKAADAFYRGQPGYRVTGQLEARLHDRSGEVMQSMEPLKEERTIIVRGANEFSLSGAEFRVACDGKFMYFSPANGDMYWRGDAPKTALSLAGSPMAPLFGGPDNLMILGLVDPGLEAALHAEGNSLSYVGKSEIDGKPVHHLSLQPPVGGNNPKPVGVTELWIAAEGDPVVLQLRNAPAPRAMNFGRQQIEASIVSVETYSDWTFGADVPAAAFARPEGKRRIAELGQLIRGESPLIGKPAGDGELQLLDGSTVTLSKLQEEGKIVILDFWATWCGPCRAELPFVSKLAAEVADQGVVFYGVNQGESAEQVQAFQSQVDFRFTAALDPTGALSRKFQADRLPYLCIIGRDGTIQVIHVGVGGDTERAIREELAALVSGRNLATEGLPE